MVSTKHLSRGGSILTGPEEKLPKEKWQSLLFWLWPPLSCCLVLFYSTIWQAGSAVLGVMGSLFPLAMCIRWLEKPAYQLHTLYALTLFVVNTASLLDIGSDIIVSAEGNNLNSNPSQPGVLVLLGLGGREHDQYALLARLVLVYISVIPYFLVYVLWELSAPDQSQEYVAVCAILTF